jgi:RimJ/RimL family protein N-acetyltransferase
MSSIPIQGESLKKTLDSFWSKELRFPVRELKTGEVKIVGVDHQIDIPTRWPLIAMKANDSCVIPIEHGMINDAEEIFQDFSVEAVFTDKGIKTIQKLLGISPDRVAHWLHLYCDKDNFKPYQRHGARRLTESDRKICEKWTSEYPRAIGPYSYQYANPVPYGIVINEELVSVSIVLRYDLPFWEIGVETRPDCRGRGYAKSVVSLATEEALAAGKMAWYYIDANPTNIASLKVAKALGYIEYSETLNLKQ